MEKIILTDCDEVILAWTPAFKHFCRTEHNLTYHENDHRKVVDIFGDRTFELVDEFNNDPKYFENIPAYKDAQIYLPQFHKEGYKIIVISACGRSNHIIDMRRKNLEEQFGKIFEDILTVDYHESKEEHLKKYSESWWVDDHFGHIVTGLSLGHRCIHLARIHDKDKHDNRVYDAKTFKDVYRIIKGK